MTLDRGPLLGGFSGGTKLVKGASPHNKPKCTSASLTIAFPTLNLFFLDFLITAGLDLVGLLLLNEIISVIVLLLKLELSATVEFTLLYVNFVGRYIGFILQPV